MTGTPDELRRQRRLRAAQESRATELRRDDLRFERFGCIVHEPTGSIYRRVRGEVVDAQYSSLDAYYVEDGGGIAFLEHPPGPRTLAEETEQRAAREQERQERLAASRERLARMKAEARP